MITLYQFRPGFGLPNASPFCMKVETYLRMAGLSYQLNNRGLLTKAPKGKLPFIDEDGVVIGDSSLIIAHLKRQHGDPLDAGLSPGQQAQALAWQRLFEENLYWAVVYTRWIEPQGFARTRQVFFGRMPGLLRLVIPGLARRTIRRELWGHGMGRHSPEEIMAIGCDDISAVAAFLGDEPFFLGLQPTTLDATAYAFLANLLWAPIDSPLQRHARQLPNLEAYCRRMQARYYPETIGH